MQRQVNSLQDPAAADSLRLNEDLTLPIHGVYRLTMAGKGGLRQHRITNHLAHNFGWGKLSHRARADRLAITHHGNSVANLKHFIREMRDVDNHAAVSFEKLDDLKKPAFFLPCQRGGWLVENDNSRLLLDGPRDLHHLPVTGAQVLHQLLRRESAPQALQQIKGPS